MIRGLAVVAAAATLIGVMAVPLAMGTVYHEDDLGGFHLPLRHFLARCLAEGEDPAWMPGMFGGFYLHGEGQAGLDHPAHRLLYGLLPLGTAFNLELLLSYPALFVGTVVMLRLRGLPVDASLFGGLVFAFSGFNLLHYFHMNMVAVVAHIPWLLAAIDLAWRAEGPGRASASWAAVGGLTASQVLTGYPQFVWLSGVAELLFAAGLAWRSGRVGVGRWLGLAAAKGVGLLAAAAQVLPTIDLFAGSLRNDPGARFAAINPLHPANLVQLVSPYGFRARYFDGFAHEGAWPSHEFGLYNTAAVTVLCAWALCRGRASRWPGLTRWAGILGAVGLVLAIGRYSPVGLLCERLPVVGLFRCPSRAIVLVHLASAVLAAVAFADLAGVRDRRDRLPWRRLWPMAGPLAMSLVVAVAFAAVRGEGPLGRLVGSGEAIRTGPILFLGATLATLGAARGRPGALIVLVGLTAADQATYGVEGMLRRIPPLPIASVVDLDPPPTGGPQGARTRGGTNLLMMGGFDRIDGYAGLRPRRVLDIDRPAALRVAGVGYVIREGDGPRGWRDVPDPMPMARLVTRAAASRDPGRDLEAIDPETTAIVDRPVELPGGDRGRARVVDRGTTRIDVAVEADTRQLLVLAEGHHPGWRAEVDGRPSAVLPAYGDLMACVVEAGSRRVRFTFDPPSLRLGRIGSAVGVAILVAWPVAGLAAGRLRRRPDARDSREESPIRPVPARAMVGPSA